MGGFLQDTMAGVAGDFLWKNDTGIILETSAPTAETEQPVQQDFSWLPQEMLNYTDYNSTYVDPTECLRRWRYQVHRIVIDIFIVGILCVVGFTGNTMAIIVLRTDGMNSTVSFLLQALAVADNCYLVTCIFIQTMKAVYECTLWVPGLVHVFPKIEPFIWPLASMAQTTAVWIVVLVTTDRYFAICKPFNMGRFCNPSRAKKLVALITCLAVVYNIPRFFEFQKVTWPDFCRETVLVLNIGSAMRMNETYFLVYKTCLYFLVRLLIPLGTLSVLNTRLIMTLRGARRNRAALTNCPSSSSTRRDSVTLVLVSVVSVFIICEMPDFIFRIAVTVKVYFPYDAQLYYINTITNMLLTVNSSVNCLIYCLTGRRFRKVLKRQFCPACSSPRRNLLVMDDQHTTENGVWKWRSTRKDLSATISTDANQYTSMLRESLLREAEAGGVIKPATNNREN